MFFTTYALLLPDTGGWPMGEKHTLGTPFFDGNSSWESGLTNVHTGLIT